MVGLPYPNLKSPELKEKMDYLNANMVCQIKSIFCLLLCHVIIIMINLNFAHILRSGEVAIVKPRSSYFW